MSDMRTWAAEQDDLERDFASALDNPNVMVLAQFYQFLNTVLTEITFDKEVEEKLETIQKNLLDLMRLQSRVPLNRLAISKIIDRRLSNG